MPFVEESEPLSTIQSLLNDNWVSYSESPLPEIIIANDPEETISRVDFMNMGDYIIISMSGNEDIRYRGNVTYYDRIFPIALNVLTKESRQRLRDIYKVIRSICFIKKHNFTGWQLIKLLRYQELVGTDINIWRGQIVLQLENHGIAAEVRI